MKKIDLDDYLPFVKAVKYSGRSASHFMEYVLKGMIETVAFYGQGSLYRVRDIEKIRKVGKNEKRM